VRRTFTPSLGLVAGVTLLRDAGSPAATNARDVRRDAPVANRALELATLFVLLQRVRRHPNDWALRIRVAEQVAPLANHVIVPGEETDRLLSEAIVGARLLRRALERANKTELPSLENVAAINAWIDRLHDLLLKIIERPVR
jgi:hypothetical protein